MMALAVLVAAMITPTATAAASGLRTGRTPWQPEPASYGVSQPVAIPVRMDDGVVISTEVPRTRCLVRTAGSGWTAAPTSG
jgi:hypothetical protein